MQKLEYSITKFSGAPLKTQSSDRGGHGYSIRGDHCVCGMGPGYLWHLIIMSNAESSIWRGVGLLRITLKFECSNTTSLPPPVPGGEGGWGRGGVGGRTDGGSHGDQFNGLGLGDWWDFGIPEYQAWHYVLRVWRILNYVPPA